MFSSMGVTRCIAFNYQNGRPKLFADSVHLQLYTRHTHTHTHTFFVWRLTLHRVRRIRRTCTGKVRCMGYQVHWHFLYQDCHLNFASSPLSRSLLSCYDEILTRMERWNMCTWSAYFTTLWINFQSKALNFLSNRVLTKLQL